MHCLSTVDGDIDDCRCVRDAIGTGFSGEWRESDAACG